MIKINNLLFLLVICACLSSCYAFFKADKLIYAGSVAKKPVVINVDSVDQTTIVSNHE